MALRGDTATIPLENLLLQLSQAKLTGVLTIHTEPLATIYLHRGQVTGVNYGHLRDRAALKRLLLEPKREFHLNNVPPPEREGKLPPVEQLLLNLSREIDEEAREGLKLFEEAKASERYTWLALYHGSRRLAVWPSDRSKLAHDLARLIIPCTIELQADEIAVPFGILQSCNALFAGIPLIIHRQGDLLLILEPRRKKRPTLTG